jgi:fructosamine-3-kinase
MRDPASQIAAICGKTVADIAPLSGGSVAKVMLVRFADGSAAVAKQGARLALEAWMLGELARTGAVPVPRVIHADDALLLLEFIEAGDAIDASAQRHAAELLAALHAITAPSYGLERDTLIGGLDQPNSPSRHWLPFFRDRRLLHMADEALQARGITPVLRSRIDKLAARLGEWIEEPAQPSLIHGDMWGGNVLVHRGRIAAFVDPAIYYADREIELAFATLFDTFDHPFFDAYHALKPIAPGFWEARRELYNLYPLLVHARLFGGAYAGAIDRTLTKFGV